MKATFKSKARIGGTLDDEKTLSIKKCRAGFMIQVGGEWGDFVVIPREAMPALKKLVNASVSKRKAKS